MSIENPNGNIAKKVKKIQSFEFNGSNADNTLRFSFKVIHFHL